ncbi:hypothetical protein TKK_0019021 [Trichogramma kaykai]
MEDKLKTKKYCIVRGCDTVKKSHNDNISFHKPRNNDEEKYQWCLALKMKELPRMILYQVSNGLKKYLKVGVIPSQNLPVTLKTSLTRDHNLPKKRKERLERRNAQKKLRLEKEQEIVEENSNQREYSNQVSSPVHVVDQTGSNEQTTAERDFADDENQVDDSFNGQYAADPIKKDQSIQVDYQKSIISSLCDSDENLKTLTGIKSNKLLNMLIDCISDLRKNMKKKTIQILSIRECILLTFVKLYQNVTYRVLSVYFGLTSAMAKKCFVRTLKELALVLKSVLRWPSKQEILSNMPKYFNDYKETRIVLDCLEIPVKRSKCLKCRLLTYSNYKSRNTIKFMIGTTPSGLISYVSKAYGGRVSDKAIFKRSRLLNRMKRGIDAIMVDKGFLIHKECADLGIKLIRPPFLKKKSQLSHTEVTKRSDISAARVHVERRIQRIRKFAIMQGPLSTEIVPYINIIMTVICGLTNLYSPILAADKFL